VGHDLAASLSPAMRPRHYGEVWPVRGANLEGTNGITNEKLAERVSGSKFLEGSTMPNGQKYGDWLKSREEGDSGS
jgi:hypothetical protein